MNRRIKIFLGACVNATQAQCLNCRALALHLDREKFVVGARTVYSGDLDDAPIAKLPNTKLFKVRYPAKIWAPLQLVRGIIWSDVVYWTSPGYWKLARFLCKILGKKSFGTIEGVYTGIAKERALACFGSKEAVQKFHSFTTKTFAITKAMIAKNRELVGLKEPDGVLYLGTDYEKFAAEKTSERLTDAIIIGADLKRKGIDDYLVLAKRFPQIKFHVAGGAVGGVDYERQCKESGLKNVVFHGPVSHDKLKEILRDVQLHIFPSRAEGFPKVTLETAAAGVPSLVYDDYGAGEWITTGRDGFVVKTINEMAEVVQTLLDKPELLQPLADNARELAKRFDWKMLVKDWEREIGGIVAK